MQSLFNIIAIASLAISGISASYLESELAKKQCPPSTVILVGWYAQDGTHGDGFCYEGSVLPNGNGYLKCENNAFVQKECECEGHRVRKTGMFLQCD